jgi:hypothetical protein
MTPTSRLKTLALPVLLAATLPIAGCFKSAPKQPEVVLPPPDEGYAKSLYPEGHYRATGWEVPDTAEYELVREKRTSLSKTIEGDEVISKSYVHAEDGNKQLAVVSVDAEGYADAPFLYAVRDKSSGARSAFYDTNGDGKFDTKLIGQKEAKMPKWAETPNSETATSETPPSKTTRT